MGWHLGADRARLGVGWRGVEIAFVGLRPVVGDVGGLGVREAVGKVNGKHD